MADNIKREVYSWGKSILFALFIVWFCRQFIFVPVSVQGESMVPTFDDKNKIIVAKISKIDHFDLVVFSSPVSDENHIKRVIGLPGGSRGNKE
ncbi:signal peptidase I [Peribacillus deserti]|uniref:Signal peptidase I n=1 Tax=Peribacillus deserti TaxID=673318 RepID=A0ABS2QE38_9BACI|nr:signal peptidase I [Peribacillus deserti]